MKNNRFLPLIILNVAIFALISCATENPISNAADPYVVIDPTTDYDAMYRVGFKNYENDDINIHSREVRHEMLDNTITKYCREDYKIEHEEFVKEGLLPPYGRQHNYYIYVSCATE